jgi:hypothetical protein
MDGSVGLALLVSVVAGSVGVLFLFWWRLRAERSETIPCSSRLQPCFLVWPCRWLAIKCGRIQAVQSALGVRDAKPCSWLDGLAGEQNLFIAPPVKGWILVAGSSLPDPGADVDECFHFVLALSRELGEVQFFNASRLMQHHAWIKARRNRIVRAYVWAGETLWNQGAKTVEEDELGLQCFDYAECIPEFGAPVLDAAARNVEKVPLLAALWSFDPVFIYQHLLEGDCGVAGELSVLCDPGCHFG